jgi:hypothetical protein
MCRPFFRRSVGNLWESTEEACYTFYFRLSEVLINIEEKMCAALPDNLNQFKENFAHVHLQKKKSEFKEEIDDFESK